MNNRMIPRAPEVCDSALVEEISANEHVSAMTARALIRRGVGSLEQARRFLRPSELSMFDSYLLPDMEKAVRRIRLAIERKERICVYGDYDADGVCSTAMLVNRLREMGADTEYYIPLRHSEGYGLSEHAVRLLKAQQTQLIITVDNGVSAFDEIALCAALQMDVIVTDHHSVGKTVPECVAVVAASRKDSTYPNRYLCGAGVVLKLISALNDGAYSDAELAMAAVATIADVVPLNEENRAIAANGLKYIESVRGLTALLEAAGWKQPRVDEQTVSFVIAPRLNAAGRMSTAMIGVELLLDTEEARLKEIAEQLNTDNQRRKEAETEILEEAKHQIEQEGLCGHAIILAHESWNPGVIGIVASRLCETYHLPVILFADQNGILTGSGRSIEGVDLFENLSLFSHLFLRYGGHARAAGVTLTAEKYVEFKKLFIEHIEQAYKPEDFFPAFAYDEAAQFSDITAEQVKQMRLLAPFGEKNPEPVYRFNGVKFMSLRTIGKDDKHFCSSVVQGESVLRVVAFGKSVLMEALQSAADWDLVAQPSLNVFRGLESVEHMWVCANASEEKNQLFNAFFEQRLYNGNCSDDKLAEWYFSLVSSKEAKPDQAASADSCAKAYDEAMRRHYRRLTALIGEERLPLLQLIRTLTGEELLALCVFTQLSFFTFDPEQRTVCQNASRLPQPLNESPLYRMICQKQEA
ncbi:MAG: single-stranded-DNA-specific exonuclease RecJ [Clostridiaceae bacterium]